MCGAEGVRRLSGVFLFCFFVPLHFVWEKKIGFWGCGNVRWVLGYGLFACCLGGELLRGVFGYCEYHHGLWDTSSPYRYR